MKLFEVIFKLNGSRMTTIIDGRNKTEAKKTWRECCPKGVFVSITEYR